MRNVSGRGRFVGERSRSKYGSRQRALNGLAKTQLGPTSQTNVVGFMPWQSGLSSAMRTADQ